MTKHFVACIALAAACGAVGCGREDDTAPPVATPTVTPARATAVVGGPIDVTYRLAVAPDAPAFAGNFTVFVHMVDRTREILWTDDHEPTPPTREWKPGMVVEYTRTMFVPRLPYVGPVRLEVGLYEPSSGNRFPLVGQSQGMRSYDVAGFEIVPQAESVFVVFKDGWHDPEVAGDATEWQWSRGRATLAFRNPMQDATLLLQLDQPVSTLPTPQHVQVSLGETALDAFDLPPGRRELRRIEIPAASLGGTDPVELTISVDKTFIPATVPAMTSGDTRELGVRVFRAFIEPK